MEFAQTHISDRDISTFYRRAAAIRDPLLKPRFRNSPVLRGTIKALMLALLCGGGAAARAADLIVVCNLHGSSLTPSDVRDLFLGEKQFAGSLKLVPVGNSAAQALFLDKVLKMNAAKYAMTWAKKSFRDGLNPPLVAERCRSARAPAPHAGRLQLCDRTNTGELFVVVRL
jgi:hypothetical protein